MISTLGLLFVLSFGQSAPLSEAPPAEAKRCDFSDREPMRIDHPLVGAVLRRVQPEYPLMARSTRTTGRVVVRILVDREGSVVDACVSNGHPLLREAARSAALKWKFKKNFGFRHKQPYKFIEASISFGFGSSDGWSRGRVDPAPPN